MGKDLVNNVSPAITLKPDNYAVGTNNGTVVDLAGFTSCMFVFEAGTAGVGGTVDVKIQHGDKADGTDMVDTSIAFAQVTEANDEAVYKLAYNGGKRYVRAVATVAVAACDLSVLVLRGHPRFAPVV